MDDDRAWIWPLTFTVQNPNHSSVEIVAFGEFNQCFSDIKSCAYSTNDFESWFTGCGPGSAVIPAPGTSCDQNWWVSRHNPPHKDFIGNYVVYFEDESGLIRKSVSEQLTLTKP
jgi:hypothetical protein